jgi:AraC-like DNA-binding protein
MSEKRFYQDSNLSLAGLSELIGVSPALLSQVINRKEGMNFFNYVNRCRIEMACDLLRERSDLNILEIAYESGFNSKTAFNSAFKRNTEMTPTEFRKRYV